MSINTWQISNRATTGAAATAAQACPTGSTGMVVRLRGMQCSLSGPNAGTDQLEVLDGANVVWTVDTSIVANGLALIGLEDLDIRASAGNTLTLQFVNGVGGDRESVNAQGDFVPSGWPYGQS